jgi:arylsulfatase A
MQVDDVVGQIREILRKEKISDNTILIFTSDNGCSPTANFKELEQVGHYPSAAFRGAKADIFEGGHRVPFIVEWPKGAAKNKKNSQVICSTDLFATCAELTNFNVKPNEGEDSYSFMPLLNGTVKTEIRPYTVHHSIDGSFAIRQGDWKLIFCAGSGGWSAPTPATIRNNNLNLPAMQLYNLKDDVGERNNLIDVYPQKVLELKAAMAKIILDGRSTDGPMQQNEGMDTWVQIQSIIN